MKRLEKWGISVHRAGRPGDVIQTVPPSWVVIVCDSAGQVLHYSGYATRRIAEEMAEREADARELAASRPKYATFGPREVAPPVIIDAASFPYLPTPVGEQKPAGKAVPNVRDLALTGVTDAEWDALFSSDEAKRGWLVWVEWPTGDWDSVAVYSSEEAAAARVGEGKRDGSQGRYFYAPVLLDPK